MMMDADVVAASPASVYRVLKGTGLMASWNRKPSKKGTGFEQPLNAHAYWHVDVSYINVCGTFYYLCSVLDGFSRTIVHWEIREAMKERDIEIILQRGRETFPDVYARIISDNGPQFIANDFKAFIRICGMTHVRTSPYYPQSNGKIERWHKSLKKECIRPGTPLSLEDARSLVVGYVAHYNTKRLHSAIGYVTPRDKLERRAETIHAERDRKLAVARESRRQRRQAKRMSCASEPKRILYVSESRQRDGRGGLRLFPTQGRALPPEARTNTKIPATRVPGSCLTLQTDCPIHAEPVHSHARVSQGSLKRAEEPSALFSLM